MMDASAWGPPIERTFFSVQATPHATQDSKVSKTSNTTKLSREKMDQDHATVLSSPIGSKKRDDNVLRPCVHHGDTSKRLP